jgi:hypothetical protein
MIYNEEASQAKIMYRKARSFVKGTLEGFLGTFVLPTIFREELNGEVHKGSYRDTGHISGSMLNLAGHAVMFNYLQGGKAIWTLVPIAATNLLSGVYELGRWVIKKIKDRKGEEK